MLYEMVGFYGSDHCPVSLELSVKDDADTKQGWNDCVQYYIFHAKTLLVDFYFFGIPG